ncbi:zinc finger protein 391-like [Eurosta solidaginis]|uniref:zinc finger protein 391-like n=1 Tax=Eurosta solidaginis TaxID=178769 RepID=UPI00353168F4
MCYKMGEITPQNMHTFCRTCLKKPKEKFSIWECEIFEVLATSFTCEPIEKDDKFPKFVCSKCYKKLRSFSEFRAKSLNSHGILASIAAQLNCCGNQKGRDSNQESDKPLKNSATVSAVSVLPEFSVKGAKNDYETIFCGNIEPKEEHEINVINIAPSYFHENSPDSDDTDSVDRLEVDNKDANTQNEDDRLPNLSVSIHTPNSEDESNGAGLDEKPKKVLVKRTRKIKSEKLRHENATESNKQKQMIKNVGDGGPRYQCDQCPRRCVTKENYEAHLRTHQGLKPFLCKECGRSYNRADHWREHVREIHATAKQEFKCSIEGCDKVFSRESSYRAHYRIKHKPYINREPQHYVCEDCGNRYKNITTFKEHRYKHAPIEEYPFGCDECGKKFRSKRRLQEHQWRHTGIKNFVCPHCGMKKATKNELRTHINYHTKERQWPCTKCTSVFNSSANLGMHDRVVHKGIRRFACRYCDLSFGKPDTLKHHEMRHTGEKPHGCEICGKRFIQVVALRTHMKVHSKGSAHRTSKASVT